MNQTTLSPSESAKRVTFNVVCNAVCHLLSAVIVFVLTPFLIARIGLESYGFYPIATEVVTLFSLFTGVLNATAGRYVTVEATRGNLREANRYFSTVFFSNLVLCVALLVPMGLFVAFLDGILSIPAGLSGELRWFFALSLVTVPVNALASAFGSAYMISNRTDLRAGQDLIAVLLRAAVLLALLGGGFSSSIVSVGIALAVSNGAGAAVQILMCRRLSPDLRLSARTMSLAHARRVVVSGFWYSLNRLGAFLMTGALLIVSNMVFSSERVGGYAVSLTASRFFSGILLMLAGVLLPMTTRRFARGEQDLLRDGIVKNQKLTGYFSAVGVAVGIGFCDEFFTLWLGTGADPSLRLLTILSLLPMVAVACALPIVDLGMVMDRMRRISLLFVGCGLLTLAAILAVSCFTGAGVVGVAVISCVAQILWYAFLVPLFAGRLLATRSRFFYQPLLKCTLAAAISAGLIFLVKAVVPTDGWLSFAVVLSLCAVMALAVGFLCVFGRPKFKM